MGGKGGLTSKEKSEGNLQLRRETVTFQAKRGVTGGLLAGARHSVIQDWVKIRKLWRNEKKFSIHSTSLLGENKNDVKPGERKRPSRGEIDDQEVPWKLKP